MDSSHEYDVAVTFAGEDRAYVEDVVRQVQAAGFKVFYDQDEQVALWGEDMTEFFPKVYEERARFAVMFVSRHYAAKAWTRFERRSVLLRAIRQESAYLLPVQLDATKLDGLRESVVYLDGIKAGPDGVAAAILHKLGGVHSDGGGLFNGYVPRNEHEATVLVGERPAGWEYLLFAYSLVKGVEQLQERYLDHRMGFAPVGDYIPIDAVPGVVQQELGLGLSIGRVFMSVLAPEPQQAAFGAPGEPGSVEGIRHLADRFVAVYESFISWAARLRGYATESDEVHDLFVATSRYADGPVEQLRGFVYEFRDSVDPLHAKLMAGENVELEIKLSLDTGDASDGLNAARERFRQAQLEES